MSSLVRECRIQVHFGMIGLGGFSSLPLRMRNTRHFSVNVTEPWPVCGLVTRRHCF